MTPAKEKGDIFTLKPRQDRYGMVWSNFNFQVLVHSGAFRNKSAANKRKRFSSSHGISCDSTH